MTTQKILLLYTMAMVATIAKAGPTNKDSTSIKLNEVVVTGTRQATDIRHLPQTVTVVGRQKLTENERINVLPSLMEQVPGLLLTSRGMMGFGVSTGGSGGMMLRGISSAAGQVMVLIDGHPQYQGIYGHSISDAYQTMMTERVEVLRGPASLLYGSNAMGGVVNIVTRGMHQDGIINQLNVGAGSYGTVQAEFSNQVRKGKFSSTVAGQYARTDNHRPHMGFEQYGGYVKLNYDLTSNWNIYADADVTHFNASYPGTISAPMLEADQWITRGVVNVGVENHYEKTSGRLSVYDNFGRHKINDGYNALNGKPQTRLFRSNDALMGLSWYQSFNLWTGNRITAGFDYQRIYGKAYYTSRETGEELKTQNKQSAREQNHEVAGYVDIRQDLNTWLTIDAGVRVDNHTITGTQWIPQAGLVVRPLDSSEMKVMISKGFRNPTMREMYLYPPSNTELEPESMWTYELSWKQRLFKNRFQYGVNLFLIKAKNIIQTVNKKNVNTGELENRGIELEASYAVNHKLTLHTNHSFLHMKNPVVSAPKYKGYLGATYHQGAWSVNAGLMQISNLFTAIGADPTLESFTLLNATIGYQLNPTLRFWVKGENLLGQDYQYIAEMPMPKATAMAGVNIIF